MSRLKSMYQSEEEADSNWLVHSNQWSLVEEVLSGTSILYVPNANSADVQGKLLYCAYSLQEKPIFVHICIYVCLQIYIKVCVH